MSALGGVTGRRRRLLLLAWGIAFVVAIPFSSQQTEHLTEGGFETPGSDSYAVDSRLGSGGSTGSPNAGIVVEANGAGPGEVSAALAEARREAADVPGVSVAREDVAPPFRGRDIAILPLVIEGGFDQRVDTAADLHDAVAPAAGDRVGVQVIGQDALWSALHDVQKKDLQAAEGVGFPITLIILLAVFGSLSAALLPFALGAVSVTLTGAAVYFLSRSTDMSVFVTNAASMLGIGVAIDYSLFVLARYRQEIARGASEDDARSTALQTSGVAVVFSGLTVVVALLGIFLVDSTVLRSLSLGVVVVVAFSVLGAITLLPALIATLGRRAYEPGRIRGLTNRVVGVVGRGRRHHDEDFWTRWTHRVMDRPIASIVVASAIMLVLAVPALSISLGDSALDQFPSDDPTRLATEAAGEAAGPGGLAPVLAVADFRSGVATDAANRRALARWTRSLRKRRDVAGVGRPVISNRGRRVELAIAPVSAPDEPPARGLVSGLRAEDAAGGGLARVADVRLGGPTALTADFVDLVESSMWKVALFIVVTSFLILTFMLRSLLLPLKAVFMTLLSVASAYGVLVAIFQWGWLDGLLGYSSPGEVGAIVPALLLATVFGLSMDYEVFLLSRIRELREGGCDDREAVARGLRASAGTITSAALIMVSVFLVFAAVSSPAIQEIGVGLAVAVALDATLVRLVLVPATMRLLGAWNWWLPRALDRRLPRLAHEAMPPQEVP
jgi:RND superfamily putative drug exporter